MTERIENFLLNLKRELGALWMALGMLGLGALLHLNKQAGLVLCIIAVSNFALFLSWDSDPWVLGIGILALSLAGALRLTLKTPRNCAYSVIVVILIQCTTAIPFSLANYYGAEEAGVVALKKRRR